MKEKLKIWSKKWWFWIIIIVLVLGILGSFGDNSENNTNTSNIKGKKYTLVGGTTSEYGRKVVLNENTNLPTTKYLYKIPAGTYKVTTTYDYLSEFWIVKDTVVKTGPEEYPEELSYVGEAYDLTNGDNDFNGRASKEVTVKIEKDESVLINGTETLLFESK